MSSSTFLTQSEPEIKISLYSIFASRRKLGKEEAVTAGEEEEKSKSSSLYEDIILPSNFQVSSKIDEELRRDNQLVASFLLTLNDPVNSVTFDLRGSFNIVGSSADFESVMGADNGKNTGSRIPKILDMLYQRLYPIIFMLAGMTSSAYPQSTTLLNKMSSNQPTTTIMQQQQSTEALTTAAVAKTEVKNNEGEDDKKVQPTKNAQQQVTKTA
jgi:hypothetical protein